MKWYNKRISKLRMWSIGFTKTVCMLFGLFIATFIPSAFLISWRWIWLILGLVLAIPVFISIFRK
ncbi:MAG: hypothetical protein ABH817_02430 [archaeon]